MESLHVGEEHEVLKTTVVSGNFYLLHLYLVELNVNYLVYGLSNIERARSLQEFFGVFLKEGVVQNVVDEVVNELCSRENFLATGLDALVDRF